MNRLKHPPSPLPEPELQRLLDEVFADLGWTTDEVQLVIWGEIRQ